jgi:homoserine O-succinyltransferase/O-acetyltransferase
VTYIHHPFRSSDHSSLDRPLIIGFVNNTSDRALASTEAQFMRLLSSTSHEFDVRLGFFTCSEIPRSGHPNAASGEPYRDISELFSSWVDALVITGMEPQATRLEDEPAWLRLTELLDWAECHGIPTICSCLAAQIAVLHLVGLPRSRQVGGKLSDIFDCELAATNHPLAVGLPPRWSVPHSRYYGIAEAPLVAKGYEVLSRSALAGVDIFVKNLGTQFLFFQGHPEYDPDTLLREYKRDVRRFVTGERDEYPVAPRCYFDPQTAYALAALRQEAMKGRRALTLLDEVGDLIRCAVMPNPWDAVARKVYANWLGAAVQPNAPSRVTRSSQLDVAIAQGRQSSAVLTPAISK